MDNPSVTQQDGQSIGHAIYLSMPGDPGLCRKENIRVSCDLAPTVDNGARLFGLSGRLFIYYPDTSNLLFKVHLSHNFEYEYNKKQASHS